MLRGIRIYLGVVEIQYVGVNFFEFLSTKCYCLFEAEIVIVKRLIQGHNNVIRVRIEARSCDQGCRKNEVFTHSATLPTAE